MKHSGILAAAMVLVLSIGAQAGPLDGNGNRVRPIVVPTAAGIDITVAPNFAAPAVAVIANLVAAGFTPRKLTCKSFAASHVDGSLHFRSRACDIEQCGWGCTPAPKQTLRMIVARHGLRDGCEFGDAGHFDDGPHLPYARVLRHCGRAYAEAIYPGGGGRLVKLEARP
jgi:hypothetical protein